MSLYVDSQFVAAVAAMLGETIGFVRRRGFHLERPTEPADSEVAGLEREGKVDSDEDTLDLATVGVDWDADDDSRRYRRRRRLNGGRHRPGAA